MKYVVMILIGVGLGFLVAHRVSKTEQGRAFLAKMDATAKDVADSVKQGYAAREAQLRKRSPRA
ncbi:MAG: hypothetical protein F2808_02175 [Actinobacteria bacterium]|uniref:Unannotated protein n=1 Tax=freshwater metagenome TaxID=449393 RepID=A0A6J7F9K1_9ZZZZ|nr:hypothetical protein [Actinomycetota bacterium]